MRPIREVGTPTEVDSLPGGSPTDSPHRPALVRTLAQRADQLPDHPAVVELSSDETLGYGRFFHRIQRTARHLRAHGLGPEDRVGILLERSIDQVVALLAVLDTGAAFVPLDPSYPRERLEWMIRDAECRWILTDDSLPSPAASAPDAAGTALDAPDLDTPDLDVTRLDFRRLELDSPATDTPLPRAPLELAEAAAYVIYTSGSTGRPKGVVVPHRALDWYTQVCGRHYGLTSSDRLLQLASASFDISVGEIFPTLASGGTLLLAPPGPVDAVELLERCAAHRVTILFPATALWHELARALAEDPERLPPSLRLVSFGGEKVAANRLADWRRAVGGRVLLINGYGPTETTVEATLHRLTSSMIAAEPGEAQAIGHPVEGVVSHILDPWGRVVAPGAAGELCLDSPGLARGYLGQPARTAECFVPDPDGRVRGGRIYRTGDRVRQRPDGGLEILGRLDRQTKIRGFRIEPGEIEHHLRQHPEVAEVAVVVLAGDGPAGLGDVEGEDDRWLAAFVGLRDPSARPVRDARTPDRDGPRGATGILGVGGAASDGLDGRTFRTYLQDRVPAHLVPQAIHVLDRLPLDGNLKIDRRALALRALEAPGATQATIPRTAVPHSTLSPGDPTPSDPRPGEHNPLGETSQGGRSPAEALLVELWRRILRVEGVEPGDDYFALGGDSILGIRIASQAQRAGLPITPRDLFEHPKLSTLAALAERRAANQAKDADPAPEEPPAGTKLPLTPVQRWFFDAAELDRPWHFNQSLMVTVERRVEAPILDRALRRVVAHHDALRLRFERDSDGRARQRVAEAEPHNPLLHLDLSGLPEGRRRTVFDRAADQVQGRFDLERGPLIRAALVEGLGRPRLLLAVHHLVVDGVSWGILLADLESLALCELEGGAARPLVATTSYGRWALLQAAVARSGGLESEIPRWTSQPVPSRPLPIDRHLAADRGEDRKGEDEDARAQNTLGSEARVSRALGRRATGDLLRRAGEAYRTHINDLLITALAMTIGRWTGEPLWVDLEGHGREELVPGLDLSRTVGWFTSTFPVGVELPGLGAAESTQADGGASLVETSGFETSAQQLAAWIPRVKETLRAFPNHGIGFGILHDLADDRVAAPLRALPRPEISFNYLGQLDALLAESRLFAATGEGRGREKGGDGRRPYLFEIDGGIVDGRLWINWSYSTHLHSRTTVEALAEGFRAALETLIDHCLDPSVGALTPSDVRLTGLDGATLADLLPRPREVEDLYPLAPMQEGMLFHSLLEPETPIYLEQSSWRIEGPLDLECFRAAWQQTLDRHAILRSAFHWQGLDPPLQAVHRRCRLPWAREDWSDLPESRQAIRFDALLAADRRRGFELDRPPLTRVCLVRMGPEHHRLLWTYHHALLDGWSISVLFEEVFALYDALRRGVPLAARATVPFRDYVAWLAARRDGRRAEGERFFRRSLADFAHPTPLPVESTRGEGEPLAETQDGGQDGLERLLEDDLGQALDRFARHHRVTAGTVVQAAWGLLLARSQRTEAPADDVLFGLTVTGRPEELPGADTIVGPMINTVPVRLRIPEEGSRIDWLRQVQGQLSELRQHTDCSLVDLRRWTSVPAGQELFETLLVFENYPVEQGALEEEQRRGDLTLGDFRGFSETNYPLTLAVVPGHRWRFDLAWSRDRLGRADAERLLDRLEHLLRSLVASPEEPLATLDFESDAPRTSPRTPLPPAPQVRPPEPRSKLDPRSEVDPRSTAHDVRLEALWREVLETDRAEAEDDFFELGGHSLMAMGLLARLRQELGVELPLRALFDQPTLGALSAQVGESLRQRGHLRAADPGGVNDSSGVSSLSVVPVERPEHPLLASNQRRLWILDRLEPGDPAYHIAGAWDLRGKLDPAALDAAVAALVARHEALRTCFPEHGGEPYQQVRTPDSARRPLPHVDLRRLGERSFSEARRLADRLALRPFDLEHGPLLRIVRLEVAERRTLLVKAIHHIVSDAASEDLFYRELAMLYRAARRRHPARLPALTAQPADAVPWQDRRWPESVRRPRLEALCRNLEHLPTLELPRDRTRDLPHRVGHLRHRLPRAITAPLSQLAATQRASLSMAMTAALAVLVRRLGGGDDLPLGSPVANRPTPEHGRWIGFFVETVILRLGLDGGDGFAHTLATVRETALDAWGLQDVPFDRVVDRLAPVRRPGRPPLVQVMVDWVESPHATLPLDGVRGTWVELAGSSGAYDLAVTCQQTKGQIVLDLEFDAGRYDRTSVLRWAQLLERMLVAAIDDPVCPIDGLPGLSVAERYQLLVETGDPAIEPSEIGLLRLSGDPSAVGLSLIDGTTGQSFEPQQLAAQQAAWWRTFEQVGAVGAAQETTIGVLVERNFESLAASLAVLAAGAVWHPIDPEDPPAHQATLVTSARVDFLVGAPQRLDTLAEILGEDWSRIAPQPPTTEAPTTFGILAHQPNSEMPPASLRRSTLPHDPQRAAAILQTSGSTGRPKGVVLTWGALAGYAADAAHSYRIGPESRVLQFAHWTFDLWLEEVLPTLHQGATLVLRDPETATPEGFWSFCRRHRISHATLPTAFWHRLVDALPEDPADLPDEVAQTPLCHLIVGGEKVDPTRRRRWRSLGRLARPDVGRNALGSLVFHDTYGPTEATVVCARTRPLAGGESSPRVDGDLGRPIAGTRLVVVDPCLRPVPLGVAGELAVAGRGLARGYRGQGAVTARRFVPDPFADGSDLRPAGGRLYLTGDRARRRSDGALQFLGRLDRQLKIRGFRAEPAAIEGVLRRLSGLREAIVGARNLADTPRLVAWTVPADPADPPSVEALRAHCRRHLPQHLHPTVWVSTDVLPLDRRGKVDHRRLPEPESHRPGLETLFRPPSGPVEKALARVWCEVLELKSLGADDDFFDLGGDSLLAIRATDGARRSGFSLEPMDLLRHPTVARLARALVVVATGDDTGRSPDLRGDAPPREIPLTPIQRWFFDWRIEQRGHFNQSFRLVAKRPLDPARVEHAVATLLAHHDTLRLRFERRSDVVSEGADGWLQRLLPVGQETGGPAVVTWDLSRVPGPRASLLLDELCSRLQASLDLAQGPLLRIAVLKLPGGAEQLLIVVHHLLIDGVSWPILLADLETAYSRSGDAVPRTPRFLPSKTTPYRRWSAALLDRARHPEVEAEVPYWSEVLARRQPLPTDFDAQLTTNGASQGIPPWIHRRLDGETTGRLLRDGRRIETRLLTALLRALTSWSGHSGLLLELESHGRSLPFLREPGEPTITPLDVSRTLGWFTSTYPVWLERVGEDLETQLEAVARQLSTIPARGFHFGLLRHLAPASNGTAELRRQPGPEVNFNYLGRTESNLAHSELFEPRSLDPGPEQGDGGETLHLFDVGCRVVAGELLIDWTYDPTRIHRSTADALTERTLDDLRRIAERIR